MINNAAIVPHFMWGTELWPSVHEMTFDFWKNIFDTNDPKEDYALFRALKARFNDAYGPSLTPP